MINNERRDMYVTIAIQLGSIVLGRVVAKQITKLFQVIGGV